MRNLVVWLMLLLAGWLIGWYSHERWQENPALSERVLSWDPRGVATELQSVEASPETANPVDELRHLLKKGLFQSAIERYEALQLIGDEADVERARQEILITARSLLKNLDSPRANQLLQLYLVAEFRDVDARVLLAEVYRQQKDVRASIEQLFEAIGYAYRPEILEQLRKRLRTVVAEQTKSYTDKDDQSGLLDLYQFLTQMEPSYAPHFIGLASAQLAMNEKDNARRSLQLVLFDPEVGTQARVLLDQLLDAEFVQQSESAPPVEEVIGIPLVRNGHHFLVDARFNFTNPVRLLIDTGASMTVLTPKALDRSGIQFKATGKQYVFNTANGPVTAPIYKVETLSIADWQVSNLEVSVMELSGSPSIDGLLGMNFLKHFQFYIDQNQATLRLSLATQ